MSRDLNQIRREIKDAQAKYQKLVDEQVDMLARAGSIDNFSTSEAGHYDRVTRGADKLGAEIDRLNDEWKDGMQEIVRSGRGGLENGDGAGPAYLDRVRRDTNGGDAIRSRGLRTLEDLNRRDEVGRALTTSQLDGLDSMIRRSTPRFDGSYIAERLMLTENDAYRSAFKKYIESAATGQPMILNSEEADAVNEFRQMEIRRTMSENTTTAGGFGVPVFVDSSIIVTSGAADVPLLRMCRVEQITTNLWTGVSSAGMSWTYSTEGTEVADGSPTLAQPSVRVHMARGYIPFSIEVGLDYSNFTAEMGRLIDQGYNDLLATKTMTGTGTNEPFGVYTALDATAASEVVTTTDGAFGAEDIFKIWNALGERYRSRASWIMSVSVQSKIRQFAANTSGSNTSAYFTIDLTGGTFRLNDRPVIMTDYSPSFSGAIPGTTGAANILAVGAWSDAYLWVNRAGMSIEQVPLTLGSNRRPDGGRALFCWARNGGNLVAAPAARLLQNQ